MSTERNTYTLLFRGEHVQTFTTVHDQQAVLLGYRRYAGPGEHETLSIPTGKIASKPSVIISMKTIAALKRWGVPSRFNTYPGQTFMILVHPGVTEITDIEEQA